MAFEWKFYNLQSVLYIHRRYVSNCRLATDLQPEVEAVMVAELEMFSLEELIRYYWPPIGPY